MSRTQVALNFYYHFQRLIIASPEICRRSISKSNLKFDARKVGHNVLWRLSGIGHHIRSDLADPTLAYPTPLDRNWSCTTFRQTYDTKMIHEQPSNRQS